jgi:hypothetical protein
MRVINSEQSDDFLSHNFDILGEIFILTAACMEMAVFKDDAPCVLLETDQRFQGAYVFIAVMIEATSTSEVALGGRVVSVFAIGHRVRGFKLGRGREEREDVKREGLME